MICMCQQQICEDEAFEEYSTKGRRFLVKVAESRAVSLEIYAHRRDGNNRRL